MADPTFTAARALRDSLDRAIREAEAAIVPAGTVLMGVSDCPELSEFGRRCRSTSRLVLGFGVRVAGMLDLECPRCGERSVMRLEVAQGLIRKAGATGGEGA